MTFEHVLTIAGIMCAWEFWRGWREASLARRRRDQIVLSEATGDAVSAAELATGGNVIEGHCIQVR